MNRPAVKKWRATRHHKPFVLDTVDQWVVDHYQGKHITAVDCAGWYFNSFGVHATVLEGDALSRCYYPDAYIEFDLATHCPTYINRDNAVLFKKPWFLKYCKFENFVQFLKTWTSSCVILNFDPVYVQHNHLKHNLRDLVTQATGFQITVIDTQLWEIKP